YQVRRGDALHERGLFYDPGTLTDDERSSLHRFASARDFTVHILADFIEDIFLRYLFDLRGTCIGFNLPWDISRLAIAHAPARGRTMHGGFSFQLSPDTRRPRVQVKHLTGRAALIQFTVPGEQHTPRGMRQRGLRVPPWRGAFVDVRTLAGALLAGSWALAALAGHLQAPHRKQDTDEHGGPLTEQYLDYACTDVQVTWECYQQLRDQYRRYGLRTTPIHRIYSEASLGKAYLREMGVRPWREQQPDVPPELIGIILSTYYGGRSEVHLRRMVSRVLYCDFLSMYPTVCTLMGLWSFVTADRITWTDATAEAQDFLERVTIADLQAPDTWRQLTMLVQVAPDDDLFPVRSKYDDGAYTIGLNTLTSDQPLWFTLADCVAAKMLTGRVPMIIRALRFAPVGQQPDLLSLAVVGNPAYHVDPATDDFYRRLIDLRSAVKRDLQAAKAAGERERAERLDAEQLALKIMANATSYGIFVELNVTEYAKPQPVICYGGDGDAFAARTPNVEEPGRYFHPLLGTLITGAARLMLALAERLVTDAGLDWAFCDTDSMALAKPDDMAESAFLERAEQVRAWFTPLNPYATKGQLFKVEDVNYCLNDGKIGDGTESLYCFAVSAKRYVLFNLDKRGHPVLRKASAHGLGHLRPPYGQDEAPASIPPPSVPLHELGVERWQYDLWYRIAEAATTGHSAQLRLDDLPGFDAPAVSRYAATTPTLLRWFDTYNADKPYQEQVRPFGFLLNFQRDPLAALPPPTMPCTDEHNRSRNDAPRPVATFDQDPAIAAERCFDRITGAPVPREHLKTYRQSLAQYHLHPEAKFLHGDYFDTGPTHRRHIRAVSIDRIGKEANRWEEQLHLGSDPEAQIVYGSDEHDRSQTIAFIREVADRIGRRALAEAAGVSVRETAAILRREHHPTARTLARLGRASLRLEETE
ncbi:MAG: hypothetical protein M3457_06645, partial [Chloroflexota bacterium]|nr:hypothetical protein [Chloroflexota bacterium]